MTVILILFKEIPMAVRKAIKKKPAKITKKKVKKGKR